MNFFYYIKKAISHPQSIGVHFLVDFPMLFSDKLYVKLMYYFQMDKKLNLENPVTFTEKIQWLKLYNRKSEYTQMVDKIKVKSYVAQKIGKKYIIPTLATFEDVNSIDISCLPNQFVIKSTNGGGNSGVIICKDKSQFDLPQARERLQKSLDTDIYVHLKEWPYKNVEKKILVEKLMLDGDSDELKDYKFFCFNGRVKFIQVIQDRRTKETIDFFDTSWNHQEFVGLNPKVGNAIACPKRPENLELMIEIANKLSENIPFVRIDLYEINHQVYFGEITFFPASGYGRFKPSKYDKVLGDMLDLKSEHN